MRDMHMSTSEQWSVGYRKCVGTQWAGTGTEQCDEQRQLNRAEDPCALGTDPGRESRVNAEEWK